MIKIRKDLSFVAISHLLGQSDRTIRRHFDEVLNVLNTRFVDENLGFIGSRVGVGNDSLSQSSVDDSLIAEFRHLATQNSTQIARELLADGNRERLIVICDGTYEYHESSANHRAQRNSYSMHKGDNLFKPFMIVSPNGFILDTFGPYTARMNDASIFNNLLEDERFCSFFSPGDIFVLDRGFRDSVHAIQEKGFAVAIPSFSIANRQQETLEANHSRLVTKVRYVVEVVNGHIETRFRFFNDTIRNSLLDIAYKAFRIACGLINKYGQRIYSDGGRENEIIQLFRERLHFPNFLQSLVTAENLIRTRRGFEDFQFSNDLPCLSLGELKRIAGGTYQVEKAVSYYFDTVDQYGSLRYSVSRQDFDFESYNLSCSVPLLVRTTVCSRFRNSVVHKVFVLIDKSFENIQAIAGYYCTCRCGSRTLGCCGHVMATIWHLTFGRFSPEIRNPAEWLSRFAIDLASA